MVLVSINVFVVRVNGVAVLNYDVRINASTSPFDVHGITIVEHLTDKRLVDDNRIVVARECIARSNCQAADKSV